MLKRLPVAMTVLMLLGLSAAAEPAQAQGECNDRGLECKICGPQKWEGTLSSAGAPYDMDCTWTGDNGGCVNCNQSLTAANADWISAEAIAEVIDAAWASELPALLEAYGDRLLYAPERSALVVTGTMCDADRLDKMVILSHEKARAFRKLDVKLVREFLAERNAALVLAQAR